MAVGTTPAGPGRGGAGVGLLLVGLLVAAALAKAWEGGQAPAGGLVEPSGSVPAGAVASPAASGAEPTTTPRPHGPLLPPSLQFHDAWGVRVLYGGHEVREHWLEAPLPMPDGVPALGDSSVRLFVVRRDDRPVRFIGLTTPAGTAPESVELAVARMAAASGSVDFRPIRVRRTGEESLLFAPVDRGDWAPGIYQLRIDLGERRTAIAIAIFAAPARPVPGG